MEISNKNIKKIISIVITRNNSLILANGASFSKVGEKIYNNINKKYFMTEKEVNERAHVLMSVGFSISPIHHLLVPFFFHR